MNTYRNRKRFPWKLILTLVVIIPLLIIGIRRGIQSFQIGITEEIPQQDLITYWESGEYQQVFSECQQILQLNPIHEDALFLHGASAFYLAISQSSEENKQQYLDYSILSLRKLISLGITTHEDQAVYLLGKAYLNKGPFYAELALIYLSQLLDSSYIPSDFLEHMAQAYSYLGNYEESIYYLDRIAQTNPNDRVFLKLAESSFGAGRYDQAEGYYLRALEVTQDVLMRKEILFQLANLYYDLKNYSQAQKILSQYLEIDYNNRDAHFLLGESYFYLGDISSARLEWHRAERIDPYYRPVLIRLYN